MKDKILLLSLLFVFILCSFPKVQAKEDKVVFETTKVAEHAYIITINWDDAGKFRNNIGVVVGDEGITLVNVMYPKMLEQLLAEIKTFSDKPIQFVINSNWDFHNTDANKALEEKGATLIAHENVKYFENTVTQLTFKDKLSLDIGTDKVIAYRSYGHSMGHINIFFEKANIMFMSDSYRDQWMTTQGPYGYKGHIKGLQSALAMTDTHTKFIPGNTSSSVYVKKDTLLKEIEIRESFVARVTELQAKSMAVFEISQDGLIQQLFKDNYERYTEYERDIPHSVRAAQYSTRLERNKGNIKNLQQYVGNYELPNNSMVDVFIEGQHLFARSKGSFYYLLVPISQDTFEFGWHSPERTIKFSRDNKKEIIGLNFNLSEKDTRFGQEISLEYLKKIGLVKRIK
jgi:glyoxylase-like metal-dependent hydrolase (beta-lactamase superfamily II)